MTMHSASSIACWRILLIAAAGLLAACAPAMDQASSCAFGGVAENGTPRITDRITTSYQDESGETINGGPEDFAVLKIDREGQSEDQADINRWRIFISTVKRPGKTNHGAIKTVVFDATSGMFEKNTLKTVPLEKFHDKLHPVGLSLVEHDDGKPYLYVINKRDKADGGKKNDGHRIEKFLIDTDHNKLIYQRHFESDHLTDPNDLLVTADQHIYVSNPRSPNILKIRGETYSNWPSLSHHHADMERSEETTGNVFRRIDRQFGFANGIAQPREDRLIVANFTGSALAVFDRDEQTGELQHLFDVDLKDAGGPDNLMLSDNQEKLYIAVHKSGIRTLLHLSFNWSSPSAVYEIDMTEQALDKPPDQLMAPRLVLDDGGEYLKAASTAQAIGEYMLVSQLKAPEVYAFACY